MKKTALLLTLTMASFSLAAQDKTKTPPPPAEQKTVTAVRTDAPIVIDGRLDEKAWQTPPTNGFTQNDPQRRRAVHGKDGRLGRLRRQGPLCGGLLP